MKKNKTPWLIILSGVIAALLLLIARADRLLVREDELVKSDALVMLMGTVADRVLQTSDLYRAGLAPRIILVEEEMTAGDSLRRRGVQVITSAEVCKAYFHDLGIPKEAITVIPGKTKSTLEEAQVIARYLRSGKPMERVIVVSSPTHTRRASLIFRKTFKKEGLSTEVMVSPALRYQESHKKPWWRRKEGIQGVSSEYIKLMSYLLIEQFQR